MGQWAYTAVAADGSRREGEIEARSRGEALQKLDASRLQPIRVRPKEAAVADPIPGEGAPAGEPSGPVTLTRLQLVYFTKEISSLLDAGLQLEPALRSMARHRELSKLKGVVERLLKASRTATRSPSPSARRPPASMSCTAGWPRRGS